MKCWTDIRNKSLYLFFTTFVVSQLLLMASILRSDALYISVMLIVAFVVFNFLNEKLFSRMLVVVIPFTYIATVFLYNTGLFNNDFKILVAIKIISFALLPLLIMGVRQFNKIRLNAFDSALILFVVINCIYFFFTGEGDGSRVSNFMQMVPFAMYLFMGKLMYLARLDLLKLEKTYLNTCVFIIAVGVVMYLAADYLAGLNLSPKNYSIESVGMKEEQFLDEFNASSYSFIFLDALGIAKRFFSVFYSGIGTAYFLSVGFIIAQYRKFYWYLLIISMAIVATLTRATWILLFVSPLVVLFHASQSRKVKVAYLIVLATSLLAFVFKYKAIFFGYFLEGKLQVSNYVNIDQSTTAHILSILVFVDLLKNNILGYGMNYDSGESFLVDVFARTGIVGFLIFLALFWILYKRFKQPGFWITPQECKIALCLVVFNLLGSLFSRENFTIIDSYMSWIYIGYVFEKFNNRTFVQRQLA